MIDKAKAYDEALERARKQRDDYQKELDKTDKNSQLASLLRAGISAIELALPELTESEDEKIRKSLIEFLTDIKEISESGRSVWAVRKEDAEMCKSSIAYLEKQKEQKSVSAEELLVKAGLKHYKDGNMWCIFVGDNIQEGICGFGNTIDEAFYQFLMEVFEKQKENIEKEYVFRPLAGTDITIAAKQAIRKADEGDRLVLAFNGAYIPVRKGVNANKIVEIYDAFIGKQKEQKPIKWTDLTWKDIVKLEGIINNVHYDFSAGIGQESFGKEVLERFRSTKGIEYLDEAEQKCWQEEEQKEQKPVYGSDFKWTSQDERCRGKLIDILELADIKYPTTKDSRDELWEWLKELPMKFPNKDAFMAGTLDNDDEWSRTEEILGVDGNPTCYKQKPEWSEEDEEMFNTLVDYVEYPSCWNLKCPREKLVAFIKSLPKRFSPQPKQEWSKEDEKIIKTILGVLERDGQVTIYEQRGGTMSGSVSYSNKYEEEIGWLKDISLNHKKFIEAVDKLCSNEWSKEDEAHRDFILESLEDQIRFCKKDAEGAYYAKQIRTAQNWLKSLRSSWKPTEEDIKMLEHIIGQYEIGNKNSKVMGYLPRVEELNFFKKVLVRWKNLL